MAAPAEERPSDPIDLPDNKLFKLALGTYNWLDERLGIGMVARATLLHSVPKSINWWYVFGSAVLTAFMLQIVTGIFLSFTYIPSPDHAYQSLDFITHQQALGNVLRGLHYWGASAMVLLIFVHMSAHFLTGSYKYPRELQWLTGSVLLLLTLAMAFTGQLLRWNQDAYWAIVVGAEQAARTPLIGGWVAQLMVAGPAVNGRTLSFVYGIHIWLIPGAMLTLIGVHLYLVIYKGISEWPVPGKPVDPKTYWAEYQEILHEDGEPFFPNGISKDAYLSLALIIVIFALAVIFGAQDLGPKANPTTPANPKPDWYLIWYFAILAMVPPASTNYVIILAPAVGFGILFLIPLANKGERHYSRRPWAIATVLLASSSTLILILLGFQEPWKPVLDQGYIVQSINKQDLKGLNSTQLAGAQLMHGEACIACHKIGDKGGLRGPDLTFIGDKMNESQLTTRVLHGGGGMPQYASVLTPKQLQELVAFLQTRRQDFGTNQAAVGSGP
jgi:ubiquinol-cytochrome c reductase cytochrome b subunit